MTDPREVFRRPDLAVPDVDLPAVHARAAELRRRRLALVAGGGALVLAVSGGTALALERSTGDDRLVPPAATSPAPRPSPSPAPSPPAPVPSSDPVPRSTAPSAPVVSPPSTRPPSLPPRTGAPRPPSATPSGPGTASTGTPAGTPAITPGGTPVSTPPGPSVPFAADDLPEASSGSGSGLVLAGVTTAPQDGYDRTVFTFTGASGAPGWRVQYVDSAVRDPSGEVVPLPGGAVLEVVLTGTGPSWAAATTTPGGTALLRQVVVGGSFEGQTQAFLALDVRAPFRVFALSAPLRVVVDVRTR